MTTHTSKTLNRIQKLEADLARNKAQLETLKQKRLMNIGQLAEKHGLHRWTDEALNELFQKAASNKAA